MTEQVPTDDSSIDSAASALNNVALDEAVEAFLSEWEEYFGEDPRGPIADNIETLLAPAIEAYLKTAQRLR